MIMPAITLWQPWACLVEIGAKTYETRAFKIPQRLLGRRVAIHAAKRKQRARDMDDDTHDAICDAFGNCHWFHTLPLGVIVATVILSECVPTETVETDPFGNYAPGRWAWKLADVRKIEPHIPAIGRQQIGWDWEIPNDAIAAIAA